MRVNLAARERWPAFAAELEERTGLPTGYRDSGALIVAADRDDAEALHRLHELQVVARARRRVAAAGALPPARARPVAAHRRRASWRTATARPTRARPRARWRRPPASSSSASRSSGSSTTRGRVTGVRTSAGADRVRRRGGGGRGVEPRARARRRGPAGAPGQGPDPRAARARRHERADRARSCARRAATSWRAATGAWCSARRWRSRASTRRSPPTASTDCWRPPGRCVPEVGELELVEAGAGLRPGTPDNAAIVGPGELDGLVWATGHWRNGVLLAPLTGEAVADLLAGGELPDELAPLAPDRFARRRCAREEGVRERRVPRAGRRRDGGDRGAELGVDRSGTAVAVDGEVIPRGEWADRSSCATARSSRCCTRCRAARRRRSRSPGARSHSRLILGTGGFRSLDDDGRGGARVGRRAGDRRDAPRRPDARAARSSTCSGEAGLEVLPNTAGCFTAREAVTTARLAREALEHRLGQARGDRRRPHAAARPGRAARGGRDARRRRLRRAALHERRPDPRPPPRGRRLRGGDAARLADRQRHGHQQPLQPAADRRGRRRAGDPRRRRRHRLRRRARDGGRLRRACCWPARSRARPTRSRWPRAMRKAVEAGYEARPAGRIPRRLYAQASSPEEGLGASSSPPGERRARARRPRRARRALASRLAGVRASRPAAPRTSPTRIPSRSSRCAAWTRSTRHAAALRARLPRPARRGHRSAALARRARVHPLARARHPPRRHRPRCCRPATAS